MPCAHGSVRWYFGNYSIFWGKMGKQQEGRILVVDDERDILFFLKGLLRQYFQTVITAGSGKEALMVLRQQEFDVLITDILMPEMDGLCLIEKARALQPDLQCMIISGRSDFDSAVRAIQHGAVNYFLKPINIDELTAAINACLEQQKISRKVWEAHRELEEAIEQRTAELLQSRAESQAFVHLFNVTSDSVIVTNRDGAILRVNPAFCKITGYMPEEVVGQNPRLLQSGHHDQSFYKKLWASLISTGGWDGEIWGRKKNGELFLQQLHIRTIGNMEGGELQYMAIGRDISEIQEAENLSDSSRSGQS